MGGGSALHVHNPFWLKASWILLSAVDKEKGGQLVEIQYYEAHKEVKLLKDDRDIPRPQGHAIDLNTLF